MEDTVTNKEAKKRAIFISRLKRKLLSRHIWVVRSVFIAGFIGVLIIIFLLIRLAFSQLGWDKYVYLARLFVFTPNEVVSEIDNRTNILLLGKSGEGHIAPDLTDTMILMSVSHGNNPSIVMTSLPRDIWITDMKTKLNSVYYYGKKKQDNGGLILAKATVEEITGVPIQYAAVVDFSGFEDVIDEIGGIDVNVEHTFTDEKYPVAGKENDDCGGDPDFKCRYETIHFEAGMVHMDGDTALKFVRSRQSSDEIEGTDFARAARQRLVIDAIMKKIQSKDVLFSYKKIKKLFSLGRAMVETDISDPEAAVLARRIVDARKSIKSVPFDESLLNNPPLGPKYDNLYVFIPAYEIDGEPSWNHVHEWFDNLYK
jgi:LCP family protein required for cell wall assembly